MATRADGLKECALRIGYKENGKPIIKHFYGKTMKEATDKRSEYEKHMLSAPAVKKMTVSEWLNQYETTYSTITQAFRNRIKDDIGYKQMSSVRQIELQRMVNKMDGYTTAYARNFISCVKGVFSKAASNGLIQRDISAALQIPKGTKQVGTHRALKKWEIRIIINHGCEHRYGPLFASMLLTGMRTTEAIGLTWNNVDLDGRLIHIRQHVICETGKLKPGTKTAAGVRDIPISDALLSILQSIPQPHNGFVFANRLGNRVYGRTFQCALKSFCTAMSVYSPNGEFGFRPHDLRHTFASSLYEAGVDVKTAQYWLGHSSVQMTLDLYTHLSTQSKSCSAEALNQFMNSYLCS